MIENQVKSYTGRYGKYVQEETVEEKDMVKGEILEMENGKVNESGIKLTDAVLTPSYMKDEAQKALFVGAAKGDVITFNPAKAFEDEAEISSLLKISKDEAKNIESDFQFKIEGITRYHESAIDQELFDKVYGEGVVTSEEEFRAKIKENIQESLLSDSEYKFGIDARDMLLAKYDNLVFPDAFLKRWLLATNENLTAETLETDYPKIIADLKWQLIKDKIAKANELKVETADIEEYAKNNKSAICTIWYDWNGRRNNCQLRQRHVEERRNSENIIDKVADNKTFEIVKNAVKVDTKEISVEDFNKMFIN